MRSPAWLRVEAKFIGSDRIGRYIATGKIGIGISVKLHIGATLIFILRISYSGNLFSRCRSRSEFQTSEIAPKLLST